MGSTGAKLYLSNADGSAEQAFATSDSLDYNPTWSADGQWIAFTSERAGSADVYRVRPDGTGLERLTDSPAYDDQTAWSPDGREVVFVTTRADGTRTSGSSTSARVRRARSLQARAVTFARHGLPTANGLRFPRIATALFRWRRIDFHICTCWTSTLSGPTGRTCAD
jgi:dipeptidyl aminopeptidase/acylaminoacyl peptidase